jgi:NAD(P)-dependent dehydrogenase (short-subunit alcohol dehydrogenase family)
LIDSGSSDPATTGFRLDGKQALVTGGTSGIGRAVAERFVAAGADVTIVGRRDDGEGIAAAIGARFAPADLAIEDEMRQLLEGSGPLDILVLNAGTAPLERRIEDTATADMERCFDVNLRHVWWGLHYGAAALSDRASVIVTASTVAAIKVPNVGDYAAAKTAAVSLAKTAALELGERGIRVNAVLPGTTRSEMTPADHWEIEAMKTMLPMGRAAIPEQDLAGLYQFLASDASRYITGQAIAADGGMTAGLSYGLLRGVGAPW